MHFFDFMQKVIEDKQAELAPPLQSGEECWYLPIFGVYHPHKPDKIRVVFDSSAQFPQWCFTERSWLQQYTFGCAVALP